MRWRLLTVFLTLSSGTALSSDSTRYFPPLSHSSDAKADSFTEKWYSDQLKALNEPTLCCSKIAVTRAYRFTWLRTFHHPVAIRIEEGPDSRWVIHTKVSSGAGGYDPGKLSIDKTRTATRNELASLKSLLEIGSPFWSLPSVDAEMGGFDGSQWIVEVRVESAYHFVDRWSPESGPVRQLGQLFIELSKVNFGEVY